MKVKGDTITVIILFVVIIGISLWISQASSIKSYSPYTPYTPIHSRNYAAFEGYQNQHTDDNTLQQNDANEPQPSKCVQLSGWKSSGVFCAPDGEPEKIDLYSQATGDLKCSNTSSGYHNSKGGLCFDDTMLQLLQTRGMNATGGYGQIGTGEA